MVYVTADKESVRLFILYYIRELGQESFMLHSPVICMEFLAQMPVACMYYLHRFPFCLSSFMRDACFP